uniref:E3 ubiquitin-protein ligase COP1-like isoform X1 n=1 Tax=Rhizophora mucronata TaxID=61149 RepID=A0A2P2KI10_RHIMU
MGGGSGSSMGSLVPAIKSDQLSAATASEQPPSLPPPPPAAAAAVPLAEELDKDMLCPICMQIMKDAFLTACGHSFCYLCILTHLRNKIDCPSCAHFLTPSLIFPNYLLNKMLERTSACQIARHASPFENLRRALKQRRRERLKSKKQRPIHAFYLTSCIASGSKSSKSSMRFKHISSILPRT